MVAFLHGLLNGSIESRFNNASFPSPHPVFLNGRDEKFLYSREVDVAYYFGSDSESRRVVEQCLAAGLNPVDFFQSASRFL